MGQSESHAIVPRDTILLLVAYADGTVSGRTTMQKLAYFAARNVGLDLHHSAHYYGPFSTDVEDAVAVNVLAGTLEENIHTFPDWHGGPDVRQYIYQLSATGEERVKEIVSEYPDESKSIGVAVAKVKKSVPDLSQRTLSTAAKIDLIVRQHVNAEGEPLPTSAIPHLAEKLGWQLEKDDVKRTLSLLQDLKMVKFA